jgi:hypothetical protein
VKHFIIGASRSGKSTYARRLSARTGWQVVSAGAWAREWYLAERDDEVSQRQIEDLTDYAVAILRAAPATTIGYISERFDLSLPTIIEGIRNPWDFCRLFDPTQDRVTVLDRQGGEFTSTVFEGGVAIIHAYLLWAIAARLMGAEQLTVHEFTSFDELPC